MQCFDFFSMQSHSTVRGHRQCSDGFEWNVAFVTKPSSVNRNFTLSICVRTEPSFFSVTCFSGACFCFSCDCFSCPVFGGGCPLVPPIGEVTAPAKSSITPSIE